MKIWHISDTHTFERELIIPQDVDMVIFSGDCSNPQDSLINEREVRNFMSWFSKLPMKYKIFVAGNHDVSIERGLVTRKDFENLGIIYLENEHITIEGFKIFGSPITPSFGRGWAFNKNRAKLFDFWENAIDYDVDIVITHGPPKQILDLSLNYNRELEQCGCKSLYTIIGRIKPMAVMFGHIHNGKGINNAGIFIPQEFNTLFSNGSVVADTKFGEVFNQGNIIILKK
jgi:Icc-related predicted phosphoesterase